jgi:hypothetical protein
MPKTVHMDQEAGRHFVGPVPYERECSDRVFEILIPQKGRQDFYVNAVGGNCLGKETMTVARISQGSPAIFPDALKFTTNILLHVVKEQSPAPNPC